MRSAIAGTKGCEAVEVNLKDGLARFKIDACCLPIQSVIKAVESAHNGMFKGAVLLRVVGTPSKASLTKLRDALNKVPGVKNVSGPDEKGVMKLTFDLTKKTLLTQLYEASRGAGVTLRDPATPSQ